MVAAHPVLGVSGHPLQALDGVRPIIDNVAAERHGIMVGLRAEDGLQGGPVAVDVREDKEFHGGSALGTDVFQPSMCTRQAVLKGA